MLSIVYRALGPAGRFISSISILLLTFFATVAYIILEVGHRIGHFAEATHVHLPYHVRLCVGVYSCVFRARFYHTYFHMYRVTRWSRCGIHKNRKSSFSLDAFPFQLSLFEA